MNTMTAAAKPIPATKSTASGAMRLDGGGGLRVGAWALRSLIGSITISALVGIYILLVGHFGDLEGRVLISALSVSAVSILAMACGAAYERGRLGLLPHAGIALSTASFVLFMVATWGRIDEEWVWKWGASLALGGTAAAHACLISLGALAPRFRWVRALGWASAFSVAGLLTALLWNLQAWNNDVTWRVIGALAISLAASTMAIPVLLRLSANEASAVDGPHAVGVPRVRYCVACAHELQASAGQAARCTGCGATFTVEFGTPTAARPGL